VFNYTQTDYSTVQLVGSHFDIYKDALFVGVQGRGRIGERKGKGREREERGEEREGEGEESGTYSKKQRKGTWIP
jgi:hypothetical protein